MDQNGLLNWIELSRSVFSKNVASLVKLAGNRKVAICVKANAYGHGLWETVQILCGQPGVEYVTVHTLDEAITVRNAGWERRIMVLGPISKQEIESVTEYDLEVVVFDKRSLDLFGKQATKVKRKIRTHLKLETGTNRQGVTEKELPAFAKIYHKYPSLGKPYGASMHFANIEDTTVHEYAEFQLKNFRHLLRVMADLRIKPTIRHTASSAAMILFDNTRFDLVRPGIAAYGHWPSKETYLSYRLLGGGNDLFQPVLNWKTRVTQIKQVPADSFVGYGCTYRTTSLSKLAVIPIGYADGYDRAISNRGYVLIKGKRAPVRGRVCMNLAMVDITDIKGVQLGEAVTLIGRDGREEISAEQLADWAKTINYEILGRLSPLIPRVVIA